MEYLGILPEEDTPIILEAEQITCVGFANKTTGRFRMVQGPRYVDRFIIPYCPDGWCSHLELKDTLADLIENGHSFQIVTIKRCLPLQEYLLYSNLEGDVT